MLPRRASPEPKIDATNVVVFMERSTEKKLQIPSSKLQRSTRSQTPNTKLQTPENPRSKLEARAAVWSLESGISLVFGAWFLVFRFRNFSGAWGWVPGVSLSGGSKTELRPWIRRLASGPCHPPRFELVCP